MLTRISNKAIAKVINGIVGAETGDQFTAKDILPEDVGIAQAQLEADQKDFDELQGWYNKLLEDYKRLKKERLIK